MFEKDNIKNFDERSVFVNYCCALLFRIYGTLDKVLESDDLKVLSEHCHNNIRNVYELFGRQIPLLGLYDMKNLTHQDYYLESCEFEEMKQSYIEGCKILFNIEG